MSSDIYIRAWAFSCPEDMSQRDFAGLAVPFFWLFFFEILFRNNYIYNCLGASGVGIVAHFQVFDVSSISGKEKVSDKSAGVCGNLWDTGILLWCGF